MSTNEMTKLSGGRPVTNISLADSCLSKGASVSKKSGYSAKFIGGSTVGGCELPVNIETKSDAQVDNQKVTYTL